MTVCRFSFTMLPPVASLVSYVTESHEIILQFFVKMIDVVLKGASGENCFAKTIKLLSDNLIIACSFCNDGLVCRSFFQRRCLHLFKALFNQNKFINYFRKTRNNLITFLLNNVHRDDILINDI